MAAEGALTGHSQEGMKVSFTIHPGKHEGLGAGSLAEAVTTTDLSSPVILKTDVKAVPHSTVLVLALPMEELPKPPSTPSQFRRQGGGSWGRSQLLGTDLSAASQKLKGDRGFEVQRAGSGGAVTVSCGNSKQKAAGQEMRFYGA